MGFVVLQAKCKYCCLGPGPVLAFSNPPPPCPVRPPAQPEGSAQGLRQGFRQPRTWPGAPVPLRPAGQGGRLATPALEAEFLREVSDWLLRPSPDETRLTRVVRPVPCTEHGCDSQRHLDWHRMNALGTVPWPSGYRSLAMPGVLGLCAGQQWAGLFPQTSERRPLSGVAGFLRQEGLSLGGWE